MVSRRAFLAAGAAVSAGRGLAAPASEKPALLGGNPVHPGSFPAWPVFDGREGQALIETLHSRKWLRVTGQNVNRFEQSFAQTFGAKGCLATCNGTSALLLSLKALGVGPGDEVIVPPYTFIATVNAVMMLYALPVFVDSDRETAQIDAHKIEEAITERTAAILPVHLGGSAADLDSILAIAARHRLPVVEDACQAHLGEWRNRKLGTYGATGCFSFQATKNMACGEGGALITDDEALLDKCFAIHSHGRARAIAGYDFTYKVGGANLRMDEFHAALASVQLTRLERQSETRDRNATYLTKLLRDVPGVLPARRYPGCTRSAWHLYMFRYRPEAFAGLPRSTFLKALVAEGIPASSGYAPLNQEPFLKNMLATRDFQALFSKERIARWEERNRCPENDKLCSEAVWLTHSMLLGSRSDMEQIAAAVRKIQAHASQLLKA
jgi:dTDP-4-amino-4,6-dideoxygalactose transaminase